MTTLNQTLEAAKALSKEDKQALLDAIQASLKPAPYTREDALRDIDQLQQARHIDDFQLHDWLDKVEEYDPERLAWHIRRLRGIGGSEIGTLWMTEHGQFHPFHSCADVVASKLLRQLPLEPEGNLQRGSMMEDPILRVKFREEMVKRYEAQGKTVRFRDDLFPKFMHYLDPDPKLVWLVGTPDDILEVDGKLIIVDYKAPTSGTIAALKRYADDEAPIYYEAQLHHYASIAQKVGLPVGGLMLASLDYDKFTFDIREIAVRPKFQQELIEVGTKYWFDYVLTGQVPDLQTNKTFSKEFELPKTYQDAVREYAVLSTLYNALKKKRDNLQDALEATSTPIDAKTDVIQAGMVNIEAVRTWDVAQLESDLQQYGLDTSSAWGKTDWNVSALVELAKNHLGVADEMDPAFDAYRKREDGKVDVVDPYKLVSLARKDLDNLNLHPYIKTESCKLALSRSTVNSSGPFVRAALINPTEESLVAAVENLAQTFDQARGQYNQMQAEAKVAKTKATP